MKEKALTIEFATHLALGLSLLANIAVVLVFVHGRTTRRAFRAHLKGASHLAQWLIDREYREIYYGDRFRDPSVNTPL